METHVGSGRVKFSVMQCDALNLIADEKGIKREPWERNVRGMSSMDTGADTIAAMVIKGIERGRFEIERIGSQEAYLCLDVSKARNESFRLCHDAGLSGPELVRTIDRLLDQYVDRELRPDNVQGRAA